MEKEKIVITKENYEKIMLKRAIILCWILLAVCFVMKLFGSNLFNVVVSNEKFIKFYDFVDTNFIAMLCVTSIYNTVLGILMVLLIDGKLKPTKIQVIYVFGVGVFCLLIKFYIPKLEMIMGFVQLILLVFVTKHKNYGILAIIYYFLFSIISQFVKGTGFELVEQGIIISLILSIDVIIMMVLLYLYSYKAKGVIMGLLFAFLSNDITQLKAYRDTLKDPKKIAKVDEKIAKLEEKKAKKEDK